MDTQGEQQRPQHRGVLRRVFGLGNKPSMDKKAEQAPQVRKVPTESELKAKEELERRKSIYPGRLENALNELEKRDRTMSGVGENSSFGTVSGAIWFTSGLVEGHYVREFLHKSGEAVGIGHGVAIGVAGRSRKVVVGGGSGGGHRYDVDDYKDYEIRLVGVGDRHESEISSDESLNRVLKYNLGSATGVEYLDSRIKNPDDRKALAQLTPNKVVEMLKVQLETGKLPPRRLGESR